MMDDLENLDPASSSRSCSSNAQGLPARQRQAARSLNKTRRRALQAHQHQLQGHRPGVRDRRRAARRPLQPERASCTSITSTTSFDKYARDKGKPPPARPEAAQPDLDSRPRSRDVRQGRQRHRGRRRTSTTGRSRSRPRRRGIGSFLDAYRDIFVRA